MKDRVQPKVEGVVGGIAIDDGVYAGERDLAAIIAHLEKPTGIRQAVEVKVIGASPLGFQRRAGKRQHSRVAGRAGHIKLGVERINRGVFEDRSNRETGEETYLAVESQAFVPAHLEHFTLCGLIFSSRVGGLRKSG